MFRARWLLLIMLASCSAEPEAGNAPNSGNASNAAGGESNAPAGNVAVEPAVEDCRVPEPDEWRDFSDKRLVETAIARVREWVHSKAGYTVLGELLAGMTLDQRAVYAAAMVIPEIEEGGFEALFRSPAGMLCPEAVGGFDLLGLKKLGDAVQAAITFAQLSPFPRDKSDRGKKIDALKASAAKWDELGLAFDESCYDPGAFNRVYGSAIYKAAAVYIRDFPNQFFLP